MPKTAREQRHNPGRPLRMWVWHHGVDGPDSFGGEGWVRLRLTNTPTTVISGGPHEEGYCWVWTRYVLDDGGEVVRTIVRQSRDCDGRFDTHHQDYADGDEIRGVQVATIAAIVLGQETPRINWHNITRSQRDYRAEAAGY